MAQPSLTLYMAPGACSIIPQILLRHAGLSYEAVGVSIKTLDEDFSTKNPKGQVPVLFWDNECITEVPAIAHVINHLAPDSRILGNSPLQFVRVCEWMNFLSGSVHAQAWGTFVRPFRFTDEQAAEPGVRRKALENLKAKAALIEAKLPASSWTVGENFTAVDAYLLAISQWLSGRAGFDLAADYPKWADLVQRVQKVEAVQDALEEEKQIAEQLNKRDG